MPAEPSSSTRSSPPQRRFSAERLAKIREIEGWHFWFVGREALLDNLLATHVRPGQDVLDVGCGTGYWSRRLAGAGLRPVGLDLRPEGLAALRRGTAPTRAVRAHATCLPLAPSSFDAVLLLDVLEHVDDVALLGEVWRVLRPGGRAFLTVPAMPALWSYRDEAAGHRRRYTRASLRRVVAGQHLVLEDLRYYHCLLLPVVVASRVLGRRGPAVRDAEERPPRLLNSAFTTVNRLEVRLGRRIRWPWGSSLIAVCRKP